MLIEKLSSTVFTPLNDGTGVLLNLDTLFYYSLNRTGAAVWQQIESGESKTLDDLVDATCRRFEVNEDAARRDVGAFIDRLEQYKMIRVV
jgi:hypothetical protein